MAMLSRSTLLRSPARAILSGASCRQYGQRVGMSPASGQFTSQNSNTAALFRSHGYDPEGCLLHRIPWGDQDSFGHLNNVQFMRYFETGRVNYFDILSRNFDGFPADFLLPKHIGPVLRRTEVDFRAQMVRNEVTAIQFKLAKIGNTSFSLEGMIINESKQEIAATAKEVLVMYDFTHRKKAEIPAGLRQVFEQRHDAEQQLACE